MSGTTALAAVVAVALPAAGGLWPGRASLGDIPFDLALLDVSAAVVAGSAAWAWLALTATVLDAWRGIAEERRGPWRLPTGARRIVLSACGVALASTAVLPAHADAGGSAGHLHGTARLSGLPLPDRAVAPPHLHRHLTLAGDRSVVVRSGDSLWSIARDDLGPQATDRAVTARWHAVYAANRIRIGPDPDLIEPGQRLRLPRKDRS
jgi:nucleoid-associated protein YgaU